MRTFIVSPSRDLIIITEPSTLSMVPRMRTVCGCWAHAAEASTDKIANEATSARGIRDEIFGMVFPSKVLVEQRVMRKYPRKAGLFRKCLTSAASDHRGRR